MAKLRAFDLEKLRRAAKAVDQVAARAPRDWTYDVGRAFGYSPVSTTLPQLAAALEAAAKRLEYALDPETKR